MDVTSTNQQVKDVIELLIRAGLSDHQKHPVLSSRGGGVAEIGITGAPDLSSSLKSNSYAEIYLALLASEAYHVRMIDGGLIQMLYSFNRRSLLAIGSRSFLLLLWKYTRAW